MLLKLYQLLSFLALPLVKLYFLKRLRNNKENPHRYHEKFGQWKIQRPQGKLIWLHTASVGELLAVLPLLKMAAEKWPTVQFLITTVTITSSEVFAKQGLNNCIHQFAPVDSYFIVKKFFKHWRPDLAVFTESELWPNLVLTAKQQCPTILLNARLSDRSYKKWQNFRSIVEAMVKSFDLVLASSKLDGKKYTELGARNLHVFGNIKEAAPPLAFAPELLEELQKSCAGRTLWLASSTHKGEEEFILAAHKELVQKYPGLLTIIAPRHPSRGQELRELCDSVALKSALRSLKEPITSETDVYIANSIGELGILYRLVDIVYIGGSLIKHGGQNAMEAARLDCALVSGPHTFNFIESIAALKATNAIIEVQNQQELIAAISLLFSNDNIRLEMQRQAKQLTADKQDILTNAMDNMEKFILPGHTL